MGITGRSWSSTPCSCPTNSSRPWQPRIADRRRIAASIACCCCALDMPGGNPKTSRFSLTEPAGTPAGRTGGGGGASAAEPAGRILSRSASR